MLKLGGILNIIIAVAHIIGLFWAEQFFEKTGAGKPMQELAEIETTLPYILTIIVAIIFFIFGLYGLSASGKLRKLPYLKIGIYTIAFIYLFRGIGEQSYNIIMGTTNNNETVQSIVAIGIGILYLFGGLKKWNNKKNKERTI
ncbi:hypothetical protein [Aquimarina muelleri]|nr:hypothetical protein [Aquimarina muelleri]MCX2764761.1 hypothetical protein [Aquimarina muelleri]